MQFYGATVGSGDAERVNLAGLLHAAEAAAPIDAVDVFGSELQKLVGAEQVSLLVTNLSGNAEVRLSHVATGTPGRDGRNERGESLPPPGSPYEQVLFSQEHRVIREEDTWTVLVPVTERGDAIGILEVVVAREPDAETIDSLRSVAHSPAYVR